MDDEIEMEIKGWSIMTKNTDGSDVEPIKLEGATVFTGWGNDDNIDVKDLEVD